MAFYDYDENGRLIDLCKYSATVSSNGSIKEPETVIRIFSDGVETPHDVECSFIKNGIGNYTITGTEGFAKEGWYIETPKDRNGFPKVLVDYQQDEDGTIHVQCYEFNFNRELTTKADIPDGRWIDIRLHKTPDEPSEEEEAVE